MKIFLLIGQSNMAGPGIARYTPEDDERLEGVYLLNGRDEWEAAKNPLNRYSTVKWNPSPGISPGVTFAEEMKKRYPDEAVGLVSNARGSSKIADWQKGELCFNEAVRRARIACQDGTLAGVLWLQGEQDAIDPADYGNYAEKLEKLIDSLRAEFANADLPFISCEIWGDTALASAAWRPGIEEVNRQSKELMMTKANCAWISCKGAEHTAEEPVHFAPAGMRLLGKRFAEAYSMRWLS